MTAKLRALTVGCNTYDVPGNDLAGCVNDALDWRAELGRRGFEVEALHELYAPEGAQQTRFEFVTPEWAQRWPFEEIWVARLRA